MPWLKVMACTCVVVLAAANAAAQNASVVHGHVYHAGYLTPCTAAAIQAWPCGKTFFADETGRFLAACSTEIDSLSVISHGHEAVVVMVNGRDHVDIELQALSVCHFGYHL